MSDAWDSSHGPARPWRSGAWALELRDDELADISYENLVVLRAVRAVVRDRNWDTAAIVVESVAAEPSALELRVRSEGLGSSFTGVIRVEAAGADLVVTCDLRSSERFDTNRTGLVLLHPPFLASTALRAIHPDGGEEETRFPEAISPHQPVRDIVGLAWRQAGLDVLLELEGDVFEMEDQRNWTDASYKTYSRPLDLPFPYRIEAGERVQQVLRVEVQPVGSKRVAKTEQNRIELRRNGSPFPRIGTGAATAPDPAPRGSADADHLLVELDLATANWRAALDRAAASGKPLDVRFILDGGRPEALDEAAAAVAGLPLIRATAFTADGPAAHFSDAATITRLRDALDRAGIDVPVVGGARSHFTELNREHTRLPAGLDGVVFSITPLFHALTTEQLVESLPMQRLAASQAVAIADGRPVHIGPITLRPRFNNVASAPPPMPVHHDLRDGYGPQLLAADDPRQSAPELAAWTIASAAAIAVPGVETICYFEEWGPRGLRSSSGAAYPVAGAITALRQLEGAESLSGTSPDGLIWAVGAERGSNETVYVANLDRREREVVVTTPRGRRSILLQPGSFASAPEEPSGNPRRRP